MIKSFSACAIAALAVAGCLHSSDSKEAKMRSADAQLEILDAKGATAVSRIGGGLASVAPPADAGLLGRDPLKDQALAGACAPSPPPQIKSFAILPAVAVLAIGWVIDYAISEASAAAQRRIAEYSAVSIGALRFGRKGIIERTREKTTTDYFYESVPRPTLAWTCVRFWSLDPADKTGKTLASEAIVRIAVAPDKDSLLIQPLRLYFDKPVALTADGKNSSFGVALAVSFEALWQAAPTGEGKVAKVFEATLLKEKIAINEPNRPRVFYYEGEKTVQQVPLVPWSLGATGPAGTGVLSVALGEAGDPPAILTFFANLAKDHGKEIGGVLKDAAKAAIGDK